jgi:hypothetical protein
MPDINRYAEWIVANQAKKGTEEFETVYRVRNCEVKALIYPSPLLHRKKIPHYWGIFLKHLRLLVRAARV